MADIPDRCSQCWKNTQPRYTNLIGLSNKNTFSQDTEIPEELRLKTMFLFLLYTNVIV